MNKKIINKVFFRNIKTLSKDFWDFFIWFFLANCCVIVQLYFMIQILKTNSDETSIDTAVLQVYKMTVYSKHPE